MRIISDQKEFEVLCGELVHEPIIFMDTEFCRRRTYYAKLSLVQIATKEQKIIIDALAIQNITPLKSGKNDGMINRINLQSPYLL